jgi:TctA family transporter
MSNRFFDVLLAAGIGLVGYIFRKVKCEPGPLLLGFVLGPLLEANLRRTLLITMAHQGRRAASTSSKPGAATGPSQLFGWA